MFFRKPYFLLFLLFFFILPLVASSSENRGIEISSGNNSTTAYFGNYHALIIGIDKYKEWNQLQTAVKDASALKAILISKYEFNEKNVAFRTDDDATRENVMADLRRIASSLTEKDNLLIYFAGHGQLDDLTGDGYWIPVEGKMKKPSTWISHTGVKSILSSDRVKGKNIVVIADSCYSGSLLRGGPSLLSLADKNYQKKLIKLSKKRSRQVISSGGIEPVADVGRDGHSLFAYYLLKALNQNDRNIIDLENLFHTRVWKPVTEIGGQRPNVGRIKTPMDEDGQFVLVLNGDIQFSSTSHGATRNEGKGKQNIIAKKDTEGLTASEWFERARNVKKEDEDADIKIVEYCSKTINLDPNHIYAYMKRAYSYASLDQFQKAIDDCTKIISIDPSYSLAYSHRASLNDYKGRYEEALEDHNKAVQLDPNRALNYNSRARTYYNLGELELAIKDYTKALDLYPSLYLAYWGRGEVYLRLAKFDLACTDFQKACDLGNCGPLEWLKKQGHCKE